MITSTLESRRRRAPTQVQPELLDYQQQADLIGASVRWIHNHKDELPPIVTLGPRIVRRRRADLLAWVAGLQADAGDRLEPPELAAARKAKKRPALVKSGDLSVTGLTIAQRAAPVLGVGAAFRIRTT